MFLEKITRGGVLGLLRSKLTTALDVGTSGEYARDAAAGKTLNTRLSAVEAKLANVSKIYVYNLIAESTSGYVVFQLGLTGSEKISVDLTYKSGIGMTWICTPQAVSDGRLVVYIRNAVDGSLPADGTIFNLSAIIIQ